MVYSFTKKQIHPGDICRCSSFQEQLIQMGVCKLFPELVFTLVNDFAIRVTKVNKNYCIGYMLGKLNNKIVKIFRNNKLVFIKITNNNVITVIKYENEK